MVSAGDKIRQARVNMGLSQHDLAIRIGVADSTIGAYERDERAQIDTLRAIASALGISLSMLLGELSDNDPETELVDQQIMALLKGAPHEKHVQALSMLRVLMEQG